MTSSVVLVTPPDDTTADGFRLLLVDLDVVQTKIISDCLLQLNSRAMVITYLWDHNSHDASWLLDKKLKSDLIIFNAASANQLIVGYMSAQRNSHYFGPLKTLATVNARTIYASEDCGFLLKFNLDNYA